MSSVGTDKQSQMYNAKKQTFKSLAPPSTPESDLAAGRTMGIGRLDPVDFSFCLTRGS